MNTQVSLYDEELRIVSISWDVYPLLSSAVTQLILKTHKSKASSPLVPSLSSAHRHMNLEDSVSSTASSQSHSRHSSVSMSSLESTEPFVNVSFTPVECSLIIADSVVNELLTPLLDMLDTKARDQVRVSREMYVAIQVDGDGLDNGGRVVELTAPLSKAGIPIFFLTTYFSDFVMVPLSARSRVVQALEERGFFFNNMNNSYVSITNLNHSKLTSALMPLAEQHTEADRTITEASLSMASSSLFASLKVSPQFYDHTKVVLVGARHKRVEDNELLFFKISKMLLNPPKFFSISVGPDGEMSLLLESKDTGSFSPMDVVGSMDEYMIPTCFDLTHLPEDATGIVAGVASCLVDEPIQMGYLSTAQSGIVMVAEEDLEYAKRVLGGRSGSGSPA